MSSEHLLESGRVKGAVVLVLILLAAFLFAQTITTFKAYKFVGGGVPVTNTLAVAGEGEVFAIPDIAQFSFSVTEEGETASEAQTKATEKMDAALAFVREQGVEEKDIKTTNFNLSPRYEFNNVECVRFPCPPQERTLVGFEVNQTIRVKLRDTEKAGDFVAGLAGTEVQNVTGPSFEIDDDETLRADARKQAIDDAKEKAEKLAADLGVTLVRIVDFSEGGGARPMMAMRSFEESADMAMGGAVPAPELPAGENRIVSNVMVTYEIR